MIFFGDALTLINCTFTANSAAGAGGGFLGRATTLTNCTFSSNSAGGSGGGMYCASGSPVLTDCVFSGNTAGIAGGGMYNGDGYKLGSPTLIGCTFTGNAAGEQGGGFYNYNSHADTDPVLSNCTFDGNIADWDGGGMYNEPGASPTLTDCTFTANWAGALGAAICNISASAMLDRCAFRGNWTVGDGGGMYNSDGSPTVTNSLFSGNLAGDGGGLYNFEANPTLANCTLSLNSALDQGGGLYNNDGAPTVTNCILWGNTAASGAQIYDVSSVTSMTYSCVEGGWPDGDGNVDADPLFVDADGPDDLPGTDDDDLHVSAGSPCIDAGSNDGVPADVHADLDGGPRFYDDLHTDDTGQGDPPIVDMGAYEYWSDCNHNGVPDGWDIGWGGPSQDCNGNNIPDECDIADGTSGDCNRNGVPDECDFADGTSADCNGNDMPDECDVLRQRLYAVDRWVEGQENLPVYRVDPYTGELTLVVELSQQPPYGGAGLSFSADGVLYALADGDNGDFDLITIDLDTGDFDTIGTIDRVYWPSDIAFTSDGTLYAVAGKDADQPGELYIISTDDATITSSGIFASDGGGQSIAAPPGGNVLYHAACEGTPNDPGSCLLEVIDLNTGNVTLISDTLANRYQSLAYDPAEQRLLGSSRVADGAADLYAIHPGSGEETFIGTSTMNYALGGMAFDPLSAEDCNANGVPDECEPGGLEDCNQNEVPDLCDIHDGTSPDCDADGVPDECETDSDGDGVIDDCDELPNDFDNDGIPDACDVDQQGGPDCNGNGVADACDLNALDPDGDGIVSADCDADGMPDECANDADQDGSIDACDDCPDDPGKTRPGRCGCGTPDTDADGDGVLDCQQDNFASLLDINGNYATVVGPEGTMLSNVQVIDTPSPGDVPAGVSFPYGVFSFDVQNVPPGSAIQVRLIMSLPSDGALNTYWKYGPTPDNPDPHWYEFLFDGTTGAEINGSMITLHLVDGLRGDGDLTANGAIVDPGAPGLSAADQPSPQVVPGQEPSVGVFWPLSPAMPFPICGIGLFSAGSLMPMGLLVLGFLGLKARTRRRLPRRAAGPARRTPR